MYYKIYSLHEYKTNRLLMKTFKCIFSKVQFRTITRMFDLFSCKFSFLMAYSSQLLLKF